MVKSRTKPSPPPFRLTVTAALGKDLVPFLRRRLRGAHRLLRPGLAELSLALVGDKQIGRLHEQFMGVAGPTDVLTFPLDHDARGRVTAGEVVVCVPEARRRAKVEGTDLRREVLLYALHGMLHLCGYDDRTPAGFRKMHRKEDRILSALGVGAVFSAGGDRDATPSRPGHRSLRRQYRARAGAPKRGRPPTGT